MKTYNIRFRNIEKLKDFIFEHEITDMDGILIQIFSSNLNKTYIEKILFALKELLPNANVIGTTTDGELIDGRILTSDIVISITLFEYSKLKSKLFQCNVEDSFLLGKNISKNLITDDTKALIIFSSCKDIDSCEVLRGLRDSKCDVVIAGAISGDSGHFRGGFVFDYETFSDSGIVALSISGDRLFVSNRFTSEWEPVGREFKITKSNKNRVYTVDKMSVYELYKKYLGKEIAEKLPLSSLQFPFVLKDENGKYLARSVLSNPQDGSLVYGTNMKLGQTVQIAFGNAQQMFENTKNIIKDMVACEPIQSLFIYASAGRRRFLQTIAHAEVEPFKVLGSTAGFYGYGEFVSNKSEYKFLNQSMTFLALSEDKNISKKGVIFKRSYKKFDTNFEITRALSNIAKISSMELEELNQKLEQRIKEEVQKNRDKDSILIHNSKLAQMGEMISMIAHQWRQPLSAISAASTGLQVKIELDKYDKNLFLISLKKIEEYVYHLSTTIDDFAQFFKPSKKREVITLDKLVDKALFILSSSFTKNSINIIYNKKEDIKVKTFSNEVIQVLINILKNAENILTSRKVNNPTIEIDIYQKGEKKYIDIIDNGGGIDEKIIDKIFDSYFTTKDKEDSTGLGLYMSKFIIEDSCHGKLLVRNDKDGAKFTIILN